MSKLSFFYAAMSAGKSATLLQAAWNYPEQGMNVVLFVADVDMPGHSGRVVSRIGISAPAIPYDNKYDLLRQVQVEHQKRVVACVMVDEAQFLTADQVWQLAVIVDRLGIPVNCYGLRTDFRGNLFRGAAELMAIADNLTEISAVCHCGRPAGMVVRCDDDGNVVTTGKQVRTDKTKYQSLCRLHWLEKTSPSSGEREFKRRETSGAKISQSVKKVRRRVNSSPHD